MPDSIQTIYLASRSYRRQELLIQADIAFELIVFGNSAHEDEEIDETPLPDETPWDYALRVAKAKSLLGWKIIKERKLSKRPVLAADTTVELAGKIIGKPVNAEDACNILRALSGKTHRVFTAIAITFGDHTESMLSTSEVRFSSLSDEEIKRYVATGDPLDKAGAYGIQGKAALFVEYLSGSYSGVMGLPLFETGLLLKRFSTR